MPAAEKEISKIKVVIIVTNAKLLFPSSFRAEHTTSLRNAGQKGK